MTTFNVFGVSLKIGINDFWPSKSAYSLILIIGICLTITPVVFAVSFSGTGDDKLTDLVNEPNKFYSFDPFVITWKMTTQFRNQFPLAKQQEQVRLAIEQWEGGSSSASGSAVLRASPTYGWTRWSGQSEVYDLRTIMTHEIGHALGSNHPDAAWFNDNGSGSPFNMNYKLMNENYIATPPSGGEIMNEGNDNSSLPSSKPPKGLGPGSIWRTLSKDELLFMDHAYPSIDFVEVGPNDPAELVIDLFAVGSGPGDTLGIGGPDTSEPRDPDNAEQGRRILTASAKVREEANLPIGFKALPRNWEITNNTGEPIKSVIITARGTNNTIPTSWSSTGAKNFTFQGALAPPPVPDQRAFNLEDVAHLFTQANNGPINNGESVDVGLRKDVWDWSVVDSKAIQEDGDFVDIGLVSLQGFNFMSPVIPDENPGLPDDIILPDGLWALQGTYRILVEGLQIFNNGPTNVLLKEINFGTAPRLDPNYPGKLNSKKLERLENLHTVRFEDPLELLPGESYFVVLAGDPRKLPEEVFHSEKWVTVLNGFSTDEQMLFHATTKNNSFTLENFALVNTGPYTDDDDDGDTIGDSTDECLGTRSDAVVNDVGCSVSQLCPCDGSWKNHGAYVKCVTHTTKDFRDAGLINSSKRRKIVAKAAKSSCGKKR